jgi:hypothetical protein
MNAWLTLLYVEKSVLYASALAAMLFVMKLTPLPSCTVNREAPGKIEERVSGETTTTL